MNYFSKSHHNFGCSILVGSKDILVGGVIGCKVNLFVIM
jgi:hypothetical protein